VDIAQADSPSTGGPIPRSLNPSTGWPTEGRKHKRKHTAARDTPSAGKAPQGTEAPCGAGQGRGAQGRAGQGTSA
jgi:hypothetical protein